MVKSANFETDSESDEEEFWDAHSEPKGHDEGTLVQSTNKESSINVLSDELIEVKKEVEADNVPQQTKYNGSRKKKETRP